MPPIPCLGSFLFMRPTLKSICILLCYFSVCHAASSVPWWNGLNVPWNHFGEDIGCNQFNNTFFEEFFSTCEKNSINSARFWLHCDGRGSPLFNENSGGDFVTGISSTFLSDLESLVQMAQNHKVVLLITLWSFDMCNNEVEGGNHPDLIRNATLTNSYIENALAPMLGALSLYDNVVWEIINEPEWCIEQTPSTTSTSVLLKEMQQFVSLITNAIHSLSAQKVTVGSASLKWNSDVSPAVGNWWKDEALSHGAALDFYQVHYYDWMYPRYVPADNTTISWGLDKPTLVGELESGGGHFFLPFSFMNLSDDNGFIGAMFWSYNADFNWELSIGGWRRFAKENTARCKYTALTQWLAEL